MPMQPLRPPEPTESAHVSGSRLLPVLHPLEIHIDCRRTFAAPVPPQMPSLRRARSARSSRARSNQDGEYLTKAARLLPGASATIRESAPAEIRATLRRLPAACFR